MEASEPSGSTGRATAWMLKALVVLVALWFGWEAISTGRQMVLATRADNRQSLSAREVADGKADGLDTAFLAWAQGRMLASSRTPTYRLLIGTRDVNYALGLWSMFELSPAREVSRGRATWLIVYGVTSTAGIAKAAGAYRHVSVFAPGFELLERPR